MSFGREHEKKLDKALSSFINEAAKLLDFEERGVFRFWDSEELRDLFDEIGFRGIRITEAFGDPPQAWLVTARRGE